MNKSPQRPKFELIPDNIFIELVRKSTSLTDLVKALGYKSRSVSASIVSRCTKLGIIINKVRYFKHSDIEIIQIAASSNSVTEVMRKLGLKTTGYAHSRFKLRLKNLGFVYGKFSPKRGKTGPKLSINEYLVDNCVKITSSNLRKRLVKEGFKENKCERCIITSWQGESISLHLDHINGIHSDNRLENLRILCPNCHSLTGTYAKIKSEQTPSII